MEFIDKLTPFVLPVFMVWCVYKGVCKDRIITDLRSFNYVVIPNNYPLPFQQDIIESIRKKKYFIVIDVSNFFFQLFVHPDYKDRFTFISYYSLERIKIFFIGFRNFLLYTQRFIDRLLKDYNEFYRAFIDNIVIFFETFED